MSNKSISEPDRNIKSLGASPIAEDLQILTYLTVEDLQTDIRKLEAQILIAKDELSDYEEGHKARPYRREFMATVRREYQRGLRELRGQIAKTRDLLRVKEALSASVPLS